MSGHLEFGETTEVYHRRSPELGLCAPRASVPTAFYGVGADFLMNTKPETIAFSPSTGLTQNPYCPYQ
jgi:hypothetical protein